MNMSARAAAGWALLLGLVLTSITVPAEAGPGRHFRHHHFGPMWVVPPPLRHPAMVRRMHTVHTTTVEDTSESGALYIYPAAGQSAEQQERDRYECHRWSVAQTGYDPSAVGAGATTRTVTTVSAAPEHPPVNPITGAAGGAALGAVGGAVAGDPGAGAAIGAAVGATAAFLHQLSGANEPAPETVEVTQAGAADPGRHSDYRRAITACLEGRGYNIQ